MTRILIIQGHPDTAKTHLCHAIADAYRDAARQNGHDVQVIDIADWEIPYLRSKSEWESSDLPDVARDGQAAIAAADHLVVIYPLWMGDIPAMLKSWIEQVLRTGFAFQMTSKGWTAALGGKSARVIVTMGMPGLAYRWLYLAHSLRSLDRNVLKFCGIHPVKWSIFGNAEDPTGKAQRGFLETAAQLGRAGR